MIYLVPLPRFRVARTARTTEDKRQATLTAAVVVQSHLRSFSLSLSLFLTLSANTTPPQTIVNPLSFVATIAMPINLVITAGLCVSH